MAPGVAQLSSPGLEKDGYQLCMKLEGVGKYEGPYDWIIGQKWALQNKPYPGNGERSVYYLTDGDPQIGGRSVALYYSPDMYNTWVVGTENGKSPLDDTVPGDDYWTDYSSYYYYYAFDDDDSQHGWTWGGNYENYRHFVIMQSYQTKMMPEYSKGWYINDGTDDNWQDILSGSRKNFMFECRSKAMGNCYSGSSTVSVLKSTGGEPTKISDLKVGDKIMANGGHEHKGKKYGTVIGLPSNPSKQADDFVEITMGKAKHTLKATKHHTFVKCSGQIVMSKDIKKGDCLKTRDDTGTGLVAEVKDVPAGDSTMTYSILMEEGVDEIAVGGVFTHSMKASSMAPEEEKKAGGLRGSA